ncbi:MAG: hypothetical protein K8V42_04910 [Enterococcus aquimarinus]|uniref:Uncharacterized protein n=1 Tax=Enterococcus aquimarinus TaxID=328396 RepID=A0A9E3ZSV7_9ENTE|nr:hypothetical protein [Enterococcus aquimarinus]
MEIKELKYLKSMVVATQNYKGRKLEADRKLRQALEASKDYNVTIKEANTQKALEIHRKDLERNKELFKDSMMSFEIVIREYIGSKFTMDLTETDLATLDNLSKIKLSPSEIKLQFEKYKHNPLLLRRLEEICNEKDWFTGEHGKLVKEFSLNFLDFDYYINKLEEFVRTCENTVREYDSIDPYIELNEFQKIAISIHENVLENDFNDITETLSSI